MTIPTGEKKHYNRVTERRFVFLFLFNFIVDISDTKALQTCAFVQILCSMIMLFSCRHFSFLGTIRVYERTASLRYCKPWIPVHHFGVYNLHISFFPFPLYLCLSPTHFSYKAAVSQSVIQLLGRWTERGFSAQVQSNCRRSGLSEKIERHCGTATPPHLYFAAGVGREPAP